MSVEDPQNDLNENKKEHGGNSSSSEGNNNSNLLNSGSSEYQEESTNTENNQSESEVVDLEKDISESINSSDELGENEEQDAGNDTASLIETTTHENMPNDIDDNPRAEESERYQETTRNLELPSNPETDSDETDEGIIKQLNKTNDVLSRNFIANAHTVTIVNNSEEERIEKKRVEEITKPLTNKDIELPFEMDSQLLINQSRALRAKRVIIIGCIHEEFAYKAAVKLAVEAFDQIDLFEYRQLFLGRQDATLEKLSLDRFLNDYLVDVEKHVTIVDLKSQLFFNSVISAGYGLAQSFEESLYQGNNSALVLSVSSETWLNSLREAKRKKKLPFEFWEIELDLLSEKSVKEATELESLISLETDNIEKLVLYVVTFFPKLNLDDFNKIVVKLIKQSNKKEKKILKQLNDWYEKTDFWLSKCNVIKAYSENIDSYVIEFENPKYRVLLKEHFRKYHSFYIKDKADILLNSNILFDLTSNIQVINNLINIVVDKLINNPINYCVRYLLSITLDISNLANYKLRLDVSEEEFLRQLQNKAISEMIKGNAINILASLLDTMLNYDKLIKVVDNYLDSLMRLGNRSIVQELVDRLRYTPNFDKFHWIKRLLNEGKSDLKWKSYNFLLELAWRSSTRISEFIDHIIKFLPEENGQKKENYSKSSLYALRFIFDYTRLITDKFNLKYYGTFPSKYWLFASLDENRTENQLMLKKIIQWIFHEDLSYALLKTEDNSELTISIPSREKEAFYEHALDVYRAILVETWYMILNWPITDIELNGEKQILSIITDDLLKEFFEIVDKEKRNSMEKVWKTRAISYKSNSKELLFKLSKVNLKKVEERKRLLDSRTRVNNFSVLLNKLIIQYSKLKFKNKLV